MNAVIERIKKEGEHQVENKKIKAVCESVVIRENGENLYQLYITIQEINMKILPKKNKNQVLLKAPIRNQPEVERQKDR